MKKIIVLIVCLSTLSCQKNVISTNDKCGTIIKLINFSYYQGIIPQYKYLIETENQKDTVISNNKIEIGTYFCY